MSLAHGVQASNRGCKDLNPSLMAAKPRSSSMRVSQQNSVHEVLRVAYARNVLLSPVLCLIPSLREGGPLIIYHSSAFISENP